MTNKRNLAFIYAAAFFRSASIGLVGVVLAVYLSRIGFSPSAIGYLLAVGLAGNALATAAVSRFGERLGRRRILIVAALVSSCGGITLAFANAVTTLIPLTFVCMLNGMGTDRSAAFTVEQAIIPDLVSDQTRTWALSWYNVALDTSGALGALSGALPVAIRSWSGMDILTAYRWVFLSYTGLNLTAAALYLLLDSRVEASTTSHLQPARTVSAETRKLVRRIAALFALDAAGGGFLTDALLAYWFFHRFGVNEKTLGFLFFVVRVLNGLSHLGAAWLARRIGLVRTMVFTHLPSSVFLLLVPLAPSFPIAAVLLLLREAVVEMDVPTRQSYVAAVVQPHERVYASGVTNLTRTGSWAATASIAGELMQHVAFSAPLLFGGTMKIAYDVLLYRSFVHLKPPEERQLESQLRPAGEAGSMKFTKGGIVMKSVCSLITLIIALIPTLSAQQQQKVTPPEWKPVEDALGRKGSMQPGDVFKFSMPRSDLRVTVAGTPIKAGLALGSWLAFKKVGNDAIVMGDLVLTDSEVEPVMMKLQQEGIEQTAVHNHLLNESPRVLYMHVAGHGDSAKLASALTEALALTKTPAAAPATSASQQNLGIDTTQIDKTLGYQGKNNNGIYQFSVARVETIHDMDSDIPPSMGTATAINFQPTGNGHAAITGDFVLIGSEVNPVIRALRDNGIQVTAVHSHMLTEDPRLFFMHFWANDDAGKLAKGLRAALDKTNSHVQDDERRKISHV